MEERRSMRQTFIEVVLLALLGLFFVAVWYINLSVTPNFYCSDMYSDMMLAKEIWEQKALFPEGWVYGNQLYVVSTPVLAALCYGIVGNPFVAMGLASSLMGIFFALSFCWMLKPVFTRRARLLALVFLMALVAFFGDAYEKTNGWQLFFTMCTYYACYGITAFLAFGCYIRSRISWNDRLWVILVMTCVLAFGTGVQSLRQTAVMTLPLLAVECLHLLGNKKAKAALFDRSLIVMAAVAVSNVLGVAAKSFLAVPQMEIFGQTALASAAQWVANLREGLVNVCTLFIRAEEFPLWVGGSIVCLCMILSIWQLVRAVREKHDAERDLLLLLLCSVACIFCIDIVLTMSVRPLYYFMIQPLMAVVIARVFTAQKGQMAAMLLVVCLSAAACYMEVFPACEKAYHREKQIYYTISNDLTAQGYETVYALWNRGEKIAIASGGALEAGFWYHTFEGIDYICNPDIFARDNETAVYYFDSTANAENGVQVAAAHNIALELVKYYAEADCYIYKSPVNLMALCAAERGLE